MKTERISPEMWLHSEPLVFTYHYASNPSKTMVFFGANDGMLHAVIRSNRSGYHRIR